jgi:hypothetical protein
MTYESGARVAPHTAALLALLVVAASPAAAQSPASRPPLGDLGRAMDALPLAGPAPVVDGRLDDQAWVAAAWQTDFVQHAPVPGAPASERTEVAVLYDRDALYVGVRLHDAHADSVVGRLGRRDEEVYSDWFYVGLDGYHDRRTGFQFGVNPRGLKRDLLLYNDNLEDAGWDAVWDAAARVDSGGWTAEFRIPFSQLRYGRSEGGLQTWGVNFRRQVARSGEVSFWSPVPRDAAGSVSLFGELRGLRNLGTPRRLELRPYTAARVTRAPGAADDPFYQRNDWFGSLGADLKYSLSSRFTLSATFNPDFGQVEADPSVVNLTAYEVFLPERRPFFLEGMDNFYVRGPQLFYSRRIGRQPQGSAALPAIAAHRDVPTSTTILGAAKLTGKTANGWSVGVLDAVTAPEDARWGTAAGALGSTRVEPAANYAVIRAVKDFRSGQSALGVAATATHRHVDDVLAPFVRTAAYAGGLDARHRFGERRYEVAGVLLGSWIEGSPAAMLRAQTAAGRYFDRVDASHLRVDSTRTTLGGGYAQLALGKIGGGHWRWQLAGTAATPGFEVNDLGYYTRADFASQSASVTYDAYRPGKLFRRWSLELFEGATWTTAGERTGTTLQASFNWELPSQWSGNAGVTGQAEALATDLLRGGPAFVRPASVYSWLSVYSDRRKPLRAELSLDASRQPESGSWAYSVSPRLRLRPSPRTDLSLAPSLSRGANTLQYLGRRSVAGEPVWVLARVEQSTASLTARLGYTFTPNLSVQGYAQPFVSAAAFADYRQVANPRAPRYANRFVPLRPGIELSADGKGGYQVDLDGDGTRDYALGDPSFNLREFRSNLVVRWEYRPGSTLYVAWSQGRSGVARIGDFSPGRDFRELWEQQGTNVVLVKLSYWLGL